MIARLHCPRSLVEAWLLFAVVWALAAQSLADDWYTNKGELRSRVGPTVGAQANVILVHGILSNESKWDPFLDFARQEFYQDLIPVPAPSNELMGVPTASPLWQYRYGVRFWTYNYDFGVLVKDGAWNLQYIILNERRADFEGKDLVLIGHSKGGRLCEAFLARHFADPGFAGLRSIVPLDRVRLAVFIDSPFQGASPGLSGSAERREQFRQAFEKSSLARTYWEPAAEELFDGRLRDYNPETRKARIIDRSRDQEVPFLTRGLAPGLELMALYVDRAIQSDIQWYHGYERYGAPRHRLIEIDSAISVPGWGTVPNYSSGGEELLDWFDRDRPGVDDSIVFRFDHFLYVGAHGQVAASRDVFDRIWGRLRDLGLLHPLEIVSTWPRDGARDAPTDKDVEIHLSRPLDGATQRALVRLVSLSPPSGLPYGVKLSPDGRVIKVDARSLQPGQTCSVELVGLTSPPFRFQFTTASQPSPTTDVPWLVGRLADRQRLQEFVSKYVQVGGVRIIGEPFDNGGGAFAHPVARGRIQDFRGGSGGNGGLMQRPGDTVYWCHGQIWYEYWNRFSGPWGQLGYPMSDEYEVPGGRRQDFEGGALYWDRLTGKVHRKPR